MMFGLFRRVARAEEGGLRVVIELAAFDSGGLEKVVLDTALEWRRLGIEVLIVSVGGLGELAAVARQAGLRVERLPERRPLATYARLLDRFAPTLAVSHFSTAGYALFTARRLPIVSFIHNVYAFFSPEQRARFAADDAHVARYISVSPKATLYAVERLGIAPARIATVPNGLDTGDYARRAAAARPPPRASLGIADDDYVFLNVAAYNLHKGHYVMAAAMRLLLAAGRRDIRIVCAGKPVYPPHLDELRAHLKQHGLEQHMLLAGYTPRIEDLFALADAFLLPSFIEGWSIAMNEAMAFGRPMILTDTGGASEVIEDGDLGVLLDNEYGPVTALDGERLNALAYTPQDYRLATALAASMRRFADDRAAWAAAGARGPAKLRARYDLQAVASRHAAVLRDVVERAR